jgi:5-methyltetrahydropteroyltriglutamate--homocysteine methyltransferase
MENSSAPFRADHVGSLLRPAALREARESCANGGITRAQLRAAQDRCIREVVARQEALGLQAVTDGELRRDFWQVDFFGRLDGVETLQATGLTSFSGGVQPPMPRVTGKVHRVRPLLVEEFSYLRSLATAATPKVTMPAPAVIYHRVGRAAVSEAAYPDLDELWTDLAAAYQAEIQALHAAGCRYLQLDDTTFAYLCDASLRQAFRERGEDPEVLLRTYARALCMALQGRPADMTVAMHTCRGNFMSTWAARGGYEAVAEVMFDDVPVDAYFLEFDSDRAGGFEPLRFVPKEKKVVLGLVTSKSPQLESPDTIRRRIDEATRYVELERLCLSPQCGFSSSHHGNRLSEDDQWRKLELVVDISRRIWG